MLLERADAETDIVRACVADAPTLPEPRHAWPGRHCCAASPASRRVRRSRRSTRFVNRWKYRADADNYGRSDYWATPLEFFRRSGDCEDYVIAKYRSLRLLGLPPDQLRMVVVQDVVRDLPHAVLAVYLGDEVLILDNLSEAVLPQQRVDRLRALLLGQRGRALGAHAARDAGRRRRHRRRTAGADPSRRVRAAAR